MAKKHKKTKIPKEIGGLKIPKDVRAAARPLGRLNHTPLGREILDALETAAETAFAPLKAGQQDFDIAAALNQVAQAGLTPVVKALQAERKPAAKSAGKTKARKTHARKARAVKTQTATLSEQDQESAEQPATH